MKQDYSKIRVGVVFIFISALFAVFVARLVYIQAVKAPHWRQLAKRQYLESIDVLAARGEIFDARGVMVAGNDEFISLAAFPLDRRDVDSAYHQLAYILKENQRNLRRKYNLKPREFHWIKRGLSAAEAARFLKQGESFGLFIRKEPTRKYPYGTTGKGILGFVDIDNRGKSGIEMMLNERLTGIDGRALIQKNGRGEEYPVFEYPVKEAVAGQSVVLTVDWDKQQIVEEELERAVEKYNAKRGMAVFINPFTGEIIAAADYKPGEKYPERPVKLGAVTDMFEPGSIFKIIAAAAAIEDGSVEENDLFYAEHGIWKLGRHVLRDDHKHDTLTFRSAFELSSNIAIGKIADKIGGDRVFSMAKRFGFGRKTRCGLNGESKGILEKPNRWSSFTTSTFAIGHGVAVTALQMAQAVGIVASGGYLSQPYIVKGCINDDGDIVERHEGKPIRVLEESTAKLLDSFMRGVVLRGTGMPVADASIPIAGKTGTAEKPNHETGGYFKYRFMASFAGYFPADSPRVAGIVVLDEPEPVHYGGHTAGPAFKNIAMKFAAIDAYDNSLAAVPDTNQFEVDEAPAGVHDKPVNLVTVPDLSGSSCRKVEHELNKLGLSAKIIGAGEKVLFTHPAAQTCRPSGSEIYCYTDAAPGAKNIVPDLTGLTIREAVRLMNEYGIEIKIEGYGRVTSQQPAPGSTIEQNEMVTVACKRDRGV